jgi:DNA-binding transcriptional LysR family regulator
VQLPEKNSGTGTSAGEDELLSFKQLEAIYWVSDLGSFSSAADKLHTSESAISKRIAELEDILGSQLFDRTLRSARLTRRGREVVEFAQSILDQRNRFIDRMGRTELTVRRFRVGVTELVALTWLPRLVEAFRDKYPDISFEPKVDLSTELCERLDAGQLDLVIVPPVFGGSGQIAVPLKEMELTWMCRPGLLPVAKGVLPVAELMKFPILAQAGRSGVDTVYDQWFRQQQLPVRKVYAGNSLVTLAALTMSGFGISYLPTLYFRDLVRQGLLQELRCSESAPPIVYHAVHRADDEIANFAASVAQLCVEVCDFAKPLEVPVAPARVAAKPGASPARKRRSA